MGKDFKRYYIFGGNTDRGFTATFVFAEYLVKYWAQLYYFTSIVFVSSRRFKIDPWWENQADFTILT